MQHYSEICYDSNEEDANILTYNEKFHFLNNNHPNLFDITEVGYILDFL